MKRHAKAIMAEPASGVFLGLSWSRAKCPTLAKTMKQQNIHRAPVIRARLLPNFSTTYVPVYSIVSVNSSVTFQEHVPGMVMKKLMPPRIIEVWKESSRPVAVKIVVP